MLETSLAAAAATAHDVHMIRSVVWRVNASIVSHSHSHNPIATRCPNRVTGPHANAQSL